MLHDQIILAGFGGQGIISLGKIIAYMGMKNNINVTHFPSYGAEMRGGTANCSVIISEAEIHSPVFTHPLTIFVMNDPSLVKFSPMLQKDGLLIMDKSLISQTPKRTDIRILSAPASEEANKIGNIKVANMILLGIYIKTTKIFNEKFAEESIKNYFANKGSQVVDINIKAFEKGLNIIA